MFVMLAIKLYVGNSIINSAHKIWDPSTLEPLCGTTLKSSLLSLIGMNL